MNKQKIKSDTKKLCALFEKYFARHNIEKSVACLEVISKIHYTLNDCYVDPFVEEGIEKIAKNFMLDSHKKDDGAVLFYDAFGLDRRGLAAIYLKALVQKKYSVVYATYESQKEKIPHLREILGLEKNSKIVFLDAKNRERAIKDLLNIARDYAFSSAFFYTTPWDIAGAVAFSLMREKVLRYQINLTDHAYWIGNGAFDFCVEFRDYGASVSKKYRGLEEKRLVKLPYYPECDQNVKFEGFPFDEKGKVIVFSGGSLYKTLGAEGTYYEIVRSLLQIDGRVVFWYAGSGDDTELKKVIAEFPGRVFFTSERKDLFQILCRCHLYLNTYPMCGGLMTQFAARAGIVPLTLIKDECSSGVLIDSKKAGNEFFNKEDLLSEAKKLICDENYREQRNKLLESQVISEEDFANEVQVLLKAKKTSFKIETHDVDTKSFTDLYADFAKKSDYEKLFVSKKTVFLAPHFLAYFAHSSKKILQKIIYGGGVFEDFEELSLIRKRIFCGMPFFERTRKFDFSVIVCEYNSLQEKLFATLKSVLAQKGVSFEVIVCDDGSKENHFEKIENFFSEQNFFQYKMVANKQNMGCLQNMLSGLRVANGKYMKGISPGDFLYDEYALFNAKKIIEKSSEKVFFGKSFYYSAKSDGKVMIYDRQNPVDVAPYVLGCYKKIRKNYLWMHDYILGADFISETTATLAYMTRLLNLVKYAEDCTFIYMIANGAAPVFTDLPLVWYEYGSGISTSGASEWQKRLFLDNKNCFDFLRNEGCISFWEHYLSYGESIFKRIFRRIFCRKERRKIKICRSEYRAKNYDTSKLLEVLK